jgi:hypothetical protein
MYRPIITSAAAILLALSPAAWSQTPTADDNQTGSAVMSDPSKEPAMEDEAMPANEQEVRAFLESQGYSEIENVEMDGEIITADATRDGQRYRVEIRRMSESQDGG